MGCDKIRKKNERNYKLNFIISTFGRAKSLTFKVFSAKLWLYEESRIRECKSIFSEKYAGNGRNHGYQYDIE